MSPRFLFRENIENDKFLCSVFNLFLRMFLLKMFSKFKTNTFSNVFSVFTENKIKTENGQTKYPLKEQDFASG